VKRINQLVIALLMVVGLFANAADRVNVNRADAETLAEVLDGIGISRARAIVEYRKSFGPFEDPYDLANVKGVGLKTIEANEAKIDIGD